MPIPRLPRLISFLLILTVVVCPVTNSATYHDGTNDCLNSAATVSFISKVITVSFWMYQYTIADIDDLIIELSSNSNNVDGAFSIALNSSMGTGRFGATIQDSITTGKYRSESLTTNRPTEDTWHHLSVVIDNSTVSGDIKFYIDGQFVASDVLDVNTKDQSSNFSTNTLYIGGRACSSLFGEMMLDEFYIHDGELSATEIYQLAFAKIRGVGKQLDNTVILYLPLHNCPDGTNCTQSNLYKDESGLGNNFTPSANPPMGKAGVILSYPGDE